MDLFKKYHTVPPVGFPNDWLVNLDYEEMKKLENFVQDKHFYDFSKRTRLEKLINKTVEEYLEPVKKNKYYRMVLSMTTEELDSMQDLSHQKYEPKFFGLRGNKDVKIRLKDEDIIPHKILEFSKMGLEEIYSNFQIAPIDPETEVTWSCDVCDGRGKNYETRTKEVHDKPMPRHPSQRTYGSSDGSGPDFQAYHRDLDEYFQSKRTVDYEVKHTCSTCNGKGIIGFSFTDFKKAVEKYNKKIEEENDKTVEINEKAQRLVEEYNRTIEVLNKKIKIWNSKCPSNAVDKSYEGKEDDDLKYFLQETQMIEKKLFETNNSSKSDIQTPTEKEQIESHLQYLESRPFLANLGNLVNEILVTMDKMKNGFHDQELEQVTKQIALFSQTFYSMQKSLGSDDFSRLIKIQLIIREKFEKIKNELKEKSQTYEKYKDDDGNKFRKSAI